MSELSNVAKVLISRLESHPQDFDYGERFGYLGDSFNTLLGINNSNVNFAGSRFAALNDTDREALAEAWRARIYKALEKEIMDAMFKSDAEFEEEKKKYVYPMGQSQALQGLQQRVHAQNQMLAGSISPLQNNTTSTGLFGSIGSALGITK